MAARFLVRPALFAAIALACAGCASTDSVPQPNLDLYRHQLVRWMESGEYQAAFQHAGSKSLAILRHAVAARKPGERLALVLDIDETSLSNRNYLLACHLDLDQASFQKWVRDHNDAPLQPTLDLFNEARAAGVDVFFITGRKENLRDSTVRQLHVAGYSGWRALLMKPDSYNLRSAVPFKSGMRKGIAAQGYRIILNMGDQYSDLEGGFADRTIKLPNPFYYIR